MISVIIPTLNAVPDLACSLPPLIEASARGLIKEVILTDGGSQDATEELAEECGACFIEGPKGRGEQLARGGTIASAPWLLFLHADSCLEAGWIEAVSAFIAHPDNARKAAYFTLKFNAPGMAPKIVAWGANMRSRLFNLPYGDQGLLIQKDLYQTLGSYASLPLFEDVELARRLCKRHGRKALYRLRASIKTSAIRYTENGYTKRVLKNLYCLSLYFAGRPPDEILRRYR